MFVVRNVFKCKPGQAKNLIERFQKAMSLMEDANQRVLVDHVADFWTVVFEIEVESMAAFEEQFKQHSERADVQEVMSGYMDSVESGYREVFRIA
jgi:heme-degrading monooxygenase HmoA